MTMQRNGRKKSRPRKLNAEMIHMMLIYAFTKMLVLISFMQQLKSTHL